MSFNAVFHCVENAIRHHSKEITCAKPLPADYQPFSIVLYAFQTVRAQCAEVQYHIVTPRPVHIFSDAVLRGQFLKSRWWPLHTGSTVIESHSLITLKSRALVFSVYFTRSSNR